MKRFLTALYLFSFILLTGLLISTQKFAAAVEYHPLLGPPLFIMDGMPIYLPYKYLEWYLKFGKLLPNVFNDTFVWAYGSAFTAFIAAGFVLKQPKKPTSHGTAAWATEKDIKNAGLLEDKGVVLGLTQSNKYMRHDGSEHVMIMAPTRSGKGVGIIIPTLLTWPHSVIVTDIKGENWEKTAGFRKKTLAQKVIKFEPTAFDGSSAKFNPFDEIRFRTPREVSDVQNITNIMVDPQGKGDLNHWQLAAQSLLVGAILYLKYIDPANASLCGLVKFLTEPSDERPGGIVDVLNEMKDTDHVEEGDEILIQLYGTSGHDAYKHPIIRQTAMEMLQKDVEELAGVVSTATAILAVYRDPVLANNLSTSTFRIKDLMNYKNPVSLYLVVPPSDIDRMNPVFRLIVELILRRSLEKLQFKHRTLLLLDEFPGLGRLDTMERALAYIAGYGLKALLVVQSLNQLHKTYTTNNSIIDNCHVRIFFTPNDANTPEYIAKMLGKFTEVVRNESVRKYEFFSASRSTMHVARDLMTPGEISLLPNSEELIFITGIPPIKAKKLFYYQDENFTSRLETAPRVSDSTV